MLFKSHFTIAGRVAARVRRELPQWELHPPPHRQPHPPPAQRHRGDWWQLNPTSLYQQPW